MAISDRPWGQFSEADYADAGAFCDAALINLNTGPRSRWIKGNCKLPVKEPSGAVNRNGVHAAAQRLMMTDAPPDQKRAAARKLMALYNEMNESAPDSVRMMAR